MQRYKSLLKEEFANLPLQRKYGDVYHDITNTVEEGYYKLVSLFIDAIDKNITDPKDVKAFKKFMIGSIVDRLKRLRPS